MSKIGRKPIDIGNVQMEIKGQEIHYKGPKASGVYVLPVSLSAQLNGKNLTIAPVKRAHAFNAAWGLHRALLANKIQGASVGFEHLLEITGLGYKAVPTGRKVVFTLGHSHKIDYELPEGITLEADKTGQKLSVKGTDKELLGHVCSVIKQFKPTEPYKGTGIKTVGEIIQRKAGKTKASA